MIKIDLNTYKAPESVQFHTESIHQQLDDPFTVEFVKKWTEVVEEIHARPGELYNTQKCFADRDIANLMEHIDKLIEERFGFGFTHVGVSNPELGDYGVFPVTPITYSSVEDDGKAYYDALKSDSKNKLMEIYKVDGEYDNYREVAKRIVQSIDNLESRLYNKGVVIDYKKAYIKGVKPEGKKGIVAVAFCNMYSMVMDAKLTGPEFAAVCLHEVGHVFNAIANMYQNTRQGRQLAESLREELCNKKKVPRDAVIATYNKIMTRADEKIDPNDKDAKGEVLAIHVSNKLATEYAKMGYTNNARLEDEMMEDRFSARFGLGGELATGLAKMQDLDSTPLQRMARSYAMISLILINLEVLIPIVTFLAVGLVSMSFILLPWFIFTAVVLPIGVYAWYDTQSVTPDNYEAYKARFESMLRENIRILKLKDGLPATVTTHQGTKINTRDLILKNCEDIETVINNIEKQISDRGLFERFLSSLNINTRYRTLKDIKYLYGKLTGDLRDNKLYLADSKLDRLKGE